MKFKQKMALVISGLVFLQLAFLSYTMPRYPSQFAFFGCVFIIQDVWIGKLYSELS